MFLYHTRSKLKHISSMMVKTKTTLISLILIISLICNIFLLTLPTNTTLPSITRTAHAFKPTNPKQSQVNNKNLIVNHPPVANTGPDQTVNESSKVMLVGVGIDSDPNDKLSYSWRQIAGPAVTLNGPDTTSPTFTAPSNVTSDTQLKFALTAKDDKGAASNNLAIVTITVKHINRPPTANAGADQTVNAGYIVSLDGSKSKDPDNGPLTYTWKQVGGPSVVLNGADTSIATFTAPSDISSDTDLTFELTVTDSKNATNTATVKVTDKYIPPPNQPPTANAGSDQTVNAGDTVTLDGSGSRDPDGNITSYSWTQTDGPAVTLSDANVASPTFTAPSVSADTTLKFSLTVTDDKGAAASSNPAVVSVTVKAAATPVSPTEPSTTQAPSIATKKIIGVENAINQPKNSASNEYSFVKKWESHHGSQSSLQAGGVLNGIALDSSSNVYVADFSRLQKFDSNGNFITEWESKTPGFIKGASSLHPITIFILTGITVDSSTHVYVADLNSRSIQKFDSNGNFITEWGSEGTGDGQFKTPGGVAVDSSGNVYVADSGNKRIQKFDSNGNFITKWGSEGTGDGQFSQPDGLAIDTKNGYVYVRDTYNKRIQVFAPSFMISSNTSK
jgi:PKD domain/NHL repeat